MMTKTIDEAKVISNLGLVARQNLRIAVALRETTFAEVSRQAGLSRNVLSQFVSGRVNISYPNMLRVCEVLDVPIGLMHLVDGVTRRNISRFQELEKQFV
jgi:transcriptional regulator with XRE-family HTH domain